MKILKMFAAAIAIMIVFSGYTQNNDSCSNPIRVCLDSTTALNAGVGSGYVGGMIDCMGTAPNPAWFCFQVQQPGRINISIASSPSRDLDFVCWGPFLANTIVEFTNSDYCSQLLTDASCFSHGDSYGPNPTNLGSYPIGNLVDCSYSEGTNEYIHIPNAETGNWYLILLTNYSNQATAINMIRDTSSVGTSNCNLNAPVLSFLPSTLSGFSYVYCSGSSNVQSCNLIGDSLVGYPSDITVVAPIDYEVSLNPNFGFGSVVSVAYTSSTLLSTPIYVRLKAGLNIGDYFSELITISGGGGDSVTINCNGSVVEDNGIVESGESHLFTLSPNPASDALSCAFKTQKNRRLSIVDVAGKTIASWESNLPKEIKRMQTGFIS